MGAALVRHIAAYLGLLALVLAAGYGLDSLTAPVLAPQHARPAANSGNTHDVQTRAFVLVLDSLRYQTATDCSTMPTLCALRRSSAFAKITPTRDAVTVPSLRAAFTGQDRTRVLGFIANFLKGGAGIESLFSDFAKQPGRRGQHALAYSDNAFDQFGASVVELRDNGSDAADEVAAQTAIFAQALALYRTHARDLIVVHVTFTDHIAHEVGIADPKYHQRFVLADGLVARLAAAIEPQDTLLVMGDHGHDARGRHALGLDVPTFALYRGARYRADTDLGTRSIREHRYLLGFGLGLPLPEDYTADRPERGLQLDVDPTLARSYAADGGGLARQSLGVPSERMTYYWLLVLGLSLGFVIWCCAACGVERATTLCALALGCAFTLELGEVYARYRGLIHEPRYATLALIWLAVWTLAGALTWWRREPRLGWSLCIAPLVFGFPTVYRYGACPALAPAWLGCLICGFLYGWRSSLWTSRDARARAAAAVLFAAAWLVPFAASEATNFRFDQWMTWPGPDAPWSWFGVALAAKLVVLVRPRSPWRAQLAALSLGVLWTLAEQDVLSPLSQLTAAGALGVMALTLWPRHEADADTLAVPLAHLRRCAGALALLLAHHALVRAPPLAAYWQDGFLAALVMSAQLVAALPQLAVRKRARALLTLFAFVSTGFVSFAWTIHALEWKFLYDAFSAPFVEHHVVWFLPLILGRYALPLWAAELLLREALPRAPHAASTPVDHGALLLIGVKLAALMLLMASLGRLNVASDVYLEAAQETAIATVLAAHVTLL